jgi:ribulose-phosphate 3-epimerase
MHHHIAPSLLASDVTCLGQEVEAVLKAGADWIHLDVMDNHYVPNLTFGPLFCEALSKRFKNLTLDVHLMVNPVDPLIEQFAASGATRISIHPDATIHLDRSLTLIRSLGCKAGLALNPTTSPEIINWCAHKLNFILIMTVNPGFGGQKLIPEVLKKIEYIHKHHKNIPICVDGGVLIVNIASLKEAGAQDFVVGNALFKSKDYADTITNLRNSLNAAHPK